MSKRGPVLNKTLIFNDFVADIETGVLQRDHGFHILQFATVSNNFPQVRSVVLRRFDRSRFKLYFHTHAQSPKVSEIKQNPKSSIVLYCKKSKKQIRLTGYSQVLKSGRIYDEHSKALTPSASRCYLGPHPPSKIIDHYSPNIPEQYLSVAPSKGELLSRYENMVLVEFCPVEGDFLWLRSNGHVRLHVNFRSELPEIDWKTT